MKENIELKPCPFCGEKNAYMTMNCYGQFYVRCPDCGVVVWGKDTDDLDTPKKAQEAWNRRPDNG